jgi:hypothetical protein
MSCGNDSENNSGRRFSKKRIAILSTIGAGVAGVGYISFTPNPAIGASMSAILAFAACPAMCAAMGGSMWLSRRFSKKKKHHARQMQQQQLPEQETKEEFNLKEKAKEKQQRLAVSVTETNGEKTVLYEQQSQQQRRKRKINSQSQEEIGQ